MRVSNTWFRVNCPLTLHYSLQFSSGSLTPPLPHLLPYHFHQLTYLLLFGVRFDLIFKCIFQSSGPTVFAYQYFLVREDPRKNSYDNGCYFPLLSDWGVLFFNDSTIYFATDLTTFCFIWSVTVLFLFILFFYFYDWLDFNI